MAENINEQIEETLEKIRPFLRRDGGDIKFVKFDEATGTVYVTMVGACLGCSMIDSTLYLGVEAILQEEVPGVNRVALYEEPLEM